MELNKENFADFIERLQHHNTGEGARDHITANPIFIVQSEKRISGIDLDYDPKFYWTDTDHELELTESELEDRINEEAEEGCEFDEFDLSFDREITRDGEAIYQKIGYDTSWHYECAHFTKEAAEAFIKRKKHDHRKLRIYVESQYWCWEFNAIIQGLLDGRIGLTESA